MTKTDGDKPAVRKRKAHTKSRRGCGNCKLRRVKCDEGKPQCKKCISFGVHCEYGKKPDEMDLAPSMTGSFQVEVPKRKGPELHTFFNEMNSSLAAQQLPSPPDSAEDELDAEEPPFELHEYDRHVFERFRSRTIWTIGTAKSVNLYSDVMPGLAEKHSFLMHMCLTITLRHDRFLLGDANDPKFAEAEAYHWYEATAQFNRVLSKPIREDQKDALWASAALLGAICFSDINATCAEEAWPLKPSDPQDLEWLRMSDGKIAVWKVSDPFRPTSLFRGLKVDQRNDFAPKHESQPEMRDYEPDIFRLCDLDADGNGAPGNAYAHAAQNITRLLAIECNGNTILQFLSFVSHLDPAFKDLLHVKDPRALFLLAMWYAKVIPWGRWWLQRRANMECQAIVTYLDRYHGMMIRLQRLLTFPRKVCGLSKAGKNVHHSSNPQPPWMFAANF